MSETQAGYGMEILRNKNIVDTMTRNVIDAVKLGIEAVDMPEFDKYLDAFSGNIAAAIADLNRMIGSIK